MLDRRTILTVALVIFIPMAAALLGLGSSAGLMIGIVLAAIGVSTMAIGSSRT